MEGRGKGALAASDRLTAFLRSVTCNGRRPAWSIKLDVASFIPSIHKHTLAALLLRRTRHPELRWLTRTLLFHDPTEDYRFRSLHGGAPPGDRRYPVGARKSLFGRDNQYGLPIGNLTSQFWANVYLNELDQFAKHTLRCRYYLRYVDDVVMLSPRPDELRAWRDAIGRFLRDALRLELRLPPALPAPVREGVDFVGWRAWPTHRVARRQTLASLQRALARFERRHLERAFGGMAYRLALPCRRVARARRPSAAARVSDLNRLSGVLASYHGHLRHGAARTDWTRVWSRHRWLRFVFAARAGRAVARWRPGVVGSACPPARRYTRLLRAAGDDVLVFLPVGRYVEFYGPQRLLAQRRLGLRPVPLARFGWGLTAGFPVWHAARFARRALAAGVGVMLPRPPAVLLLPSRWVGRAV